MLEEEQDYEDDVDDVIYRRDMQTAERRKKCK